MALLADPIEVISGTVVSAPMAANAINSGRIHRHSGKGAVEINDMQILEALLLESPRLRRRIAVEYCRARHVPLLKPHGEAFFEIDGRKKDHGDHFRKFAIKASPRRWLFSGWNWVPTMLSRATMAVSGPP